MSTSELQSSNSDSGKSDSGKSDSHDSELDQAIVEYMQACETGQFPDKQALLEKYSRVTDQLKEFFDQQSQLTRIMSPVRKFSEMVNTTQSEYPIEFGEFELLAEIGRGGMGVIYEATQKNLRRRVALKMIRESRFASKADVMRFRAEAEASAALEHPNIVPIYGVGEIEDRPYFTMKLVSGGTLKDALNEGAFVPRHAANIALAIARAVSYAHQRGILHRDLKPANILLDAVDDSHSDGSSSEFLIRKMQESQSSQKIDQKISSKNDRTKNDSIDVVPMISDFGLAKRINDERDLTMTGAVLGTPSFMSPEQAAGRAGLTTSTDVYGVGAILYNMLTGVPPFTGRSPVEITGNVLTKTPSSIRFSKSGVDLDLETICMKCLEKDASHRYLTAGELAEDLQRYLNGQPISARRSSSFEQFVKWSRRNPTLAGLFSAIAALSMIVFIGSLIFSFRTNADAVKLAEVNHDLKEQEIETASQRDQAVRALLEAKFAEVAARRSSGESGQRFKALAAARQAVEQLQYVNATDQELFELRSETAGCLGLADVEEVGTWDVPLYGDYVFAFNPTLTMFAHQTEVGQPVRIYETDDLMEAGDIALANPIAEFSAGEGEEFAPIAPRFSPCGSYLQVWTIIDSVPTFTVFDIDKRETIFQKQNVKSGCAGRSQLVIQEASELIVLNPATLEEQQRFNIASGGNSRMRISPDGKFVAQFGYRGLRVLRLDEGEVVWKVGGFNCADLAWHPFLQQVAVTNRTEMQIWKIGGDEPSMVYPNHPNEVCRVQYSPDARVLTTSTWGNTSRFWDTQSGELIFSLAGFVANFSSDGKGLGFSGAKSGILRIENEWLKRTISAPDKPHYAARAGSLAVHPNDRWAAIGTGKDVRICDLKTGKRLVDLPGGGKATFHPDGKSIFVACRNDVHRWPLQQQENTDGSLILTIGPPENALPPGVKVDPNPAIAIDPSGKFLAFVTDGVNLVDFEANKLVRKISANMNSRDLSLSGGAKLVAIGNHHRQNAQVFDGTTGELLQTIQTPTHSRVFLNADGSLLAVSFSDTAEVFETRSGKKLYSLKDSDFEVAWPVSFSPDGKYLLFNLRKPSGLLLVDAKSGHQLIRIPSATGDTPRDAPSRMTGDGYLVTCGGGNGLSTWDLGRIRGKLQELGLDWGDGRIETERVRADSDVTDVDLLPPTVEVLWADSRRETLNRELKRVRQVYGKKVARLSIEGWLADAPSDVDLLVALAELDWRHRDGEKAIESLTRAIELAEGDSVATASFLRADYYRNMNQCDKSVDEYKRYLEIVQNGDEESKQTTIAKQQLAWELARSNRNMDDAKLAKLLAVEAAEKLPSLYSQKTLAAAMYRSGEFLEAVKTIDALYAENNPLGQDSYGSLFIKSMALERLGKREAAVAAFDRELISIAKHKITSQKRTSDWVQLETEAKRLLELGDRDEELRWSAFELAATARWDCGSVRLQYFDNVRRFTAAPESGEKEFAEAEETKKPAYHLFWNPLRDNGRLQFTIEVPESGVYAGYIGLCNSSNYGEFGLVVNGTSTGLEFDGFYKTMAYGAGIELTGLELKKGTNVFSFVCKGKSPISASYYAGIEFLELRKK